MARRSESRSSLKEISTWIMAWLWLPFHFRLSFISGFTLRRVSRDNLQGIACALTFWREFYLRVAVLVCKTVL